MKQYNAMEFLNRLNKKLGNNGVPKCPFCGGEKFSTTPEFAQILIAKDLSNLSIGPNAPAGMVICEKCGHIEFFALGTLGMLTNEGDDNDAHKH